MPFMDLILTSKLSTIDTSKLFFKRIDKLCPINPAPPTKEFFSFKIIYLIFFFS